MYKYPLRFTRAYWKIPLYCHHICTPACGTHVQFDGPIGRYNDRDDASNDSDDSVQSVHLTIDIDSDYEEGDCQFYDKIVPTVVHMDSYEVHHPIGHSGMIYNPDMIVIPDSSFTVEIRFPLTHPCMFEVVCETQTGISLRETLWLIKKIYENIYNEEEATAEPSHFVVTSDACSECPQIDIRTIPQSVTTDQNGARCPICYNDLEEDVCQLPCNHYFHHECINLWITRGAESSPSCPMCRSALYVCETCDGDGRVSEEVIHVVLPLHLRDTPGRNTTNGAYGIYAHDLFNLVIENIFYNRFQRKLEVCVKSIA